MWSARNKLALSQQNTRACYSGKYLLCMRVASAKPTSLAKYTSLFMRFTLTEAHTTDIFHLLYYTTHENKTRLNPELWRFGGDKMSRELGGRLGISFSYFKLKCLMGKKEIAGGRESEEENERQNMDSSWVWSNRRRSISNWVGRGNKTHGFYFHSFSV